ncbi:SIS domain-containing protein [Vagococcus sp. BWB3-3]|uniref:SIS domain-containing protein n=1 Tax=Vagococcus allomyrinae TaxID=2794353 RepID=A0A940PDE1_9ENTE|nr:SIS domain-containing protein [Vagococcus allomyrinae]MBP1042879.1 SIS domain-containing protein [Vagococcus allomyrinae]
METVTFLDCIRRIPSLIEEVVRDGIPAIQRWLETTPDLQEVTEIIIVGSGTSDTAAQTARPFVTKMSHLPVRTIVPTEFLEATYLYPENALYLFVSQTGTSTLTRHALQFVKKQGFLHVALTESAETPLAKEAEYHLLLGCGHEEFPMRTIGYSTSAFTLMMIGLELGRSKGLISETDYQRQLKEVEQATTHQVELVDKTLSWMEGCQQKMSQSSCILFVGSADLIGLAREGAMKIWEIPQIASIGYEIEESLHGPNYGYNSSHCVIVLNDHSQNEQKLLSLARYTKDIKKNGYVLGETVIDKHDLQFDIRNHDFKFLEFSIVIQVIAYKLALFVGRDMVSPHDNSVMYSYFTTHDN